MSQGTCEEAREPLKGNLKEIADKFVEATEAVSTAGVKLRSGGHRGIHRAGEGRPARGFSKIQR
jgi:hypothetical protein